MGGPRLVGRNWALHWDGAGLRLFWDGKGQLDGEDAVLQAGGYGLQVDVISKAEGNRHGAGGGALVEVDAVAVLGAGAAAAGCRDVGVDG